MTMTKTEQLAAAFAAALNSVEKGGNADFLSEWLEEGDTVGFSSDMKQKEASLSEMIEKGSVRSGTHEEKLLMAKYHQQWIQKDHTVGTSNQMQIYYAEGGIFANCELERPVINAVRQPRMTLVNILPVISTDQQYFTYSYVTQSDDGPAGPATGTVCDDCPSVGDIATCEGRWRVGRLCFESQTGEIDALIDRFHRGVANDLFFLGDVRGISTNLTRGTRLGLDFSVIVQAAVRHSFAKLGARFERTLAYWVWAGDRTDATQNTNPAPASTINDAWRSFDGLNLLINNDYATKDFVSGTNCAALDSLVSDFSVASNGGVVCSDNLFASLQEMEAALYNRFVDFSFDSAQWIIAMHPRIWEYSVRCLPCEMAGDNCDGATVNANTGADGASQMFNMATRERLERTRQLRLNGREYNIFLDEFIPITTIAGPPLQYQSTIYFVPLQVNNIPVLFMVHKDYRLFDNQLSLIPNTQDLWGFTDGGRFHSTIIRDGRCFKINTKTEMLMVFLAPHLAGRIDNVTVEPKTDVVNDPLLVP